MPEFLPRSSCGPGWTSFLQWAYISANLLIAVSYFCLPISLIRLSWTGLPPFKIPLFRTQATIWALFLFCCGTGHVLENVLVFWWPAYRLFTAWHWFTALVSVAAAVTFPGIVKALNQALRKT